MGMSGAQRRLPLDSAYRARHLLVFHCSRSESAHAGATQPGASALVSLSRAPSARAFHCRRRASAHAGASETRAFRSSALIALVICSRSIVLAARSPTQAPPTSALHCSRRVPMRTRGAEAPPRWRRFFESANQRRVRRARHTSQRATRDMHSDSPTRIAKQPISDERDTHMRRMPLSPTQTSRAPVP